MARARRCPARVGSMRLVGRRGRGGRVAARAATGRSSLELGLQLDEACPRVEELAPVAVGILVEPGHALLGHAIGLLGRFGPPLGRGKSGAKAVVVLLEASCAPALGPEVTPRVSGFRSSAARRSR